MYNYDCALEDKKSFKGGGTNELRVKYLKKRQTHGDVGTQSNGS